MFPDTPRADCEPRFFEGNRIDAMPEMILADRPMLGFRGRRLGLVYSEISEMPARAGHDPAR